YRSANQRDQGKAISAGRRRNCARRPRSANNNRPGTPDKSISASMKKAGLARRSLGEGGPPPNLFAITEELTREILRPFAGQPHNRVRAFLLPPLCDQPLHCAHLQTHEILWPRVVARLRGQCLCSRRQSTLFSRPIHRVRPDSR